MESHAFFRARAEQIGIPSVDIDALKLRNLATYGAFAFLAPYNANSVDLTQLKTSLNDILGADPPPHLMPLWRRLQFDAHTHVLTDAKARIERTESTEPRKIPMPEKSARLDEQRRRLSHLEITTDIEPSHQLIDDVSQMVEDGVLRHISVEKCTSRRQEMGHIRKEPSMKIDSAGGIKLVQKSSTLGADTSSSLLLRLAFQRRSLAFDQCRVVTYVVHEKWVNHLFSQLSHIPPPGYAGVTLEQILQADVELWTILSNECRSGLTAVADGALPVEQALRQHMFAPQVTYAILPLPLGKFHQSKQNKRKSQSDDDDKAPRKKPKGNGKGQAKSSKGGKSDGKQSKAPSKSKAAEVFDSLSELKGMWSTVRGNPLCARYQLGTCLEEGNTSPGGWCSKGMHACCVPKCFEKHSMKDHK